MAEINENDYICIDTRVFDRCIQRKDGFIRRYDKIITDYNKIIDRLSQNWKGRGADTFITDAGKIRTNIKGIADILANMCNVLEDCRTVIAQTDSMLSEYNRNPDEEQK